MIGTLVAVDGCDHSDRVVGEAIGAAKATSANIVMAHVAPELSVP